MTLVQKGAILLLLKRNTHQNKTTMTTSKGFQLTSDQNAAIVALKAVQKIEENNKFANGDLWNNIQDQIDQIEEAARQTYISGDDKGYSPILCDQFHNA